MATVEIPTVCEFTLDNPDQIHLMTKTNGDRITIMGVSLTQEQGATLSYLINGNQPLIIKIKEA